MTCQGEMENPLGLTSPLSGEEMLWGSQEKPTLEAEDGTLEFNSSASHTA